MQKIIYILSRTFFTALLKICFGFEVKGRENIPSRGPYIIASNHISYGDPVAIGVAFDKANIIFVAKKELFEIPVAGMWFKAIGCIPIARKSTSTTALKKSLEVLRKGGILCVFPEGRRSRNGLLQKAERGISLLAYKAKVPVIPVYVQGTDKVLPFRAGFLRGYNKVSVKIGEPFDIGRYTALGERRKIYASIGEEVMRKIAKLKNE